MPETPKIQKAAPVALQPVVGQRARTPGDTKHVSSGVIVAVSECGRYKTVEKTYGTRCRCRRHYLVAQLEVLLNDES